MEGLIIENKSRRSLHAKKGDFHPYIAAQKRGKFRCDHYFRVASRVYGEKDQTSCPFFLPILTAFFSSKYFSASSS
jgi:hypothetical protein